MWLRKEYSTQQCFLSMLEKWKHAVDNGKGLLLTDLSKAFDCLFHELLLVKLHAYGFSFAAVRLVNSYLTNWKQRAKVNSSYSSWEEILFGFPQGSILGLSLFNIFLRDIDFASYTEDNTPCVSSDSIEDVIRILENDSIKLFKWFTDNMMKANKDKFHVIVSSNEHVPMKLDNIEIERLLLERLLGVEVYSKLNFKNHLDGIIKKVSRKINALSCIAPYMNIAKQRLLMNFFFASRFNYCPLVWMCHHRSVNNKINHLHERCLRIVYSDSVSSFIC